jgi:nitrite reductase (cytochrome c-552)
MKRNNYIIISMLLFMFACSKSPDPVKIVQIQKNEYEPSVWGKNYPAEYELWEKTKEPTPAGKSFYKRGWDIDGKIYDKLSEFPYMALLFKGWGFGIEYNEPRGHYFMLKDVLDIDPSRRKAGGVCLTCKTPYAQELQEKYGLDYFSKPFDYVHSLIPKQHRELGVACISCHNEDGTLKILNDFTLGNALRSMKFDISKATHQDMRSLVCAQCHVTYVVKKDKDMKSIGVFFPWQNSKYGNITIEDIIKTIKSDPSHLEWTQSVTGFKLGFIRHPEFELFSNNSTHWKAGLSCADCHMPYVRYGSYKISDHRVMSPLKNGLRACIQCHSQGEEWLRDRVKFIQDRTISMLLRSGYQTAIVAKIFEKINKEKDSGKKIDESLYQKAKDFYEEAFYRVVFIGAENSVGFHNPNEAMRILGDAIGFATKSEAILRTLAAKANIYLPEKIDLELEKYLNNRGEKKLNFDKSVEFKDPFKNQERFF